MATPAAGSSAESSLMESFYVRNTPEATPSKSSLAKNNAFGPHAPSWNLGFPDGNLTAIEIVVYCPHWLKCVDVINRFVKNDVRSVILASVINEHRDLPGDQGTKMLPNSTTVMMQYAMRRCGFAGWTVGTHKQWDKSADWNGANLHVGMFRPPRITHPKRPTKAQSKRAKAWSCNEEASPIPFKDLAIHVKKHPSGEDALDLTRCVLYAVAHPDEKWMFPVDFNELLTTKLGGPKTVTKDHYDAAAFARRSAGDLQTPRKSVRGIRGPPRNTASTASRSRPSTGAVKRSADHLGESPSARAARSAMRQAAAPQASGTRRSARNVNKAVIYDEDQEEAFTSTSDDGPTSTKRRKQSRSLTLVSDDSDYEIDDADESEDEVIATEEYDFSGLVTPDIFKRKPTADNGTCLSLAEVTNPVPLSSMRNPKLVATPLSESLNRDLRKPAPKSETPKPVRLEPPCASYFRRSITDDNVAEFALHGCTTLEQMWASALNSSIGPRDCAPHRPLYQLCNPEPSDVSDWAENIRWAKQQHKYHQSSTWTDNPYYLDVIKEHRNVTRWVSDEAIRARGEVGKYFQLANYAPPANMTKAESSTQMRQNEMRHSGFVRSDVGTFQIREGSANMGHVQHMGAVPRMGYVSVPQMSAVPQMNAFLQMNAVPQVHPITQMHAVPHASPSQRMGGFHQTVNIQHIGDVQYTNDIQSFGHPHHTGSFQQIGAAPQMDVAPFMAPIPHMAATPQMGSFQCAGDIPETSSFQHIDDLPAVDFDNFDDLGLFPEDYEQNGDLPLFDDTQQMGSFPITDGTEQIFGDPLKVEDPLDTILSFLDNGDVPPV